LKEEKEISLLEIKGIGPAKVKKLLSYFGSFEAIRKSDTESLEAVLSEHDAKRVHEYLKNISI
ncbi:MAG: helix-hairpin-helix domain-containing protein, partial [Hydrogenimonas sp.]|nr:helix-hairpin-helix domain-containing protein [Hydrogenimonas sp.]